MTCLSVNVNKLATLRNSREKNLPNLPASALKILSFGAAGITIHPRPDGRHIRAADIGQIQAAMKSAYPKAEFNIEGYPSADFLEKIERYRPHQATLVPDPPEALTSNAGWNIEASESLLGTTLEKLRAWGVRSSLFIDPRTFTRFQGSPLLRLKPDRIELYTERFAEAFGTTHQSTVLDDYVLTAKFANEHGIGVNAGHDLNQKNLKLFIQSIPDIKEVSIGHALICEALEEGMANTVQNYLRILRESDAKNSHA